MSRDVTFQSGDVYVPGPVCGAFVIACHVGLTGAVFPVLIVHMATKAELYAVAQRMGVKGRSSMNKAALVQV